MNQETRERIRAILLREFRRRREQYGDFIEPDVLAEKTVNNLCFGRLGIFDERDQEPTPQSYEAAITRTINDEQELAELVDRLARSKAEGTAVKRIREQMSRTGRYSDQDMRAFSKYARRHLSFDQIRMLTVGSDAWEVHMSSAREEDAN